MQKSVLIVVVVLVSLLLLDQYFFRAQREKTENYAVSEAFLNKGVLGELLKKNALITMSSGTQSLATNDMCAEDEAIKGYDYHNTYRLRFKMHSNGAENINLRIFFPEAKTYREFLYIINLKPGRHFYGVDFVAHKGKDFDITFTTKQKNQIILSDIEVDGRFGRTESLLKEGKSIKGRFDKALSINVSSADDTIKGVEFVPEFKKITYSVEGGLQDDFYSGVFPGKKNHGFCRYQAYFPKTLSPPSQDVVPTVKLHVDEEFLFGERGIVDNKENKGRAWEVPAEYSVQNKSLTAQQPVGLRFHGGTPGRKKNIESFRINARNAYGKPIIDVAPLFGKERAIGMKGVVFKYTYQAYNLKKTFYNPYNHALALDIANAVGALVPAHQLVDLNINDNSYGLYLAMEHLSERSVKHWLGKEDIKLYTYKKYNDEHQNFSLLLPLAEIMRIEGEPAFDIFLESYDLDNVLNSIMLSAYIADDDYCQGVELTEKTGVGEKRYITSINWDLDHAFLLFENGQFSMPAKREGLGEAFDVIKQNKPHGHSLCPRKWVFSHVYTQSKRFRDEVRQRLEAVLGNELSSEKVIAMIEKYRTIDGIYYEGANNEVIDEMIMFARQRPQVLRQAIDDLEAWIEAGDISPH